MNDQTTLTIRLPKALKIALRKSAKAQDLTSAQLARRLLGSVLAERKQTSPAPRNVQPTPCGR